MPLWARALGSTMYSSWEDECGGQPTTAATREFVHLLQHSTYVCGRGAVWAYPPSPSSLLEPKVQLRGK